MHNYKCEKCNEIVDSVTTPAAGNCQHGGPHIWCGPMLEVQIVPTEEAERADFEEDDFDGDQLSDVIDVQRGLDIESETIAPGEDFNIPEGYEGILPEGTAVEDAEFVANTISSLEPGTYHWSGHRVLIGHGRTMRAIAEGERKVIGLEVCHSSVASARLVISPHPPSEKLQDLVECIWEEFADDILTGSASGTTEFESQQYAWSASRGETCDFPPSVSRAWTRDGEEIPGFRLKENVCQDAAMGNPIGPHSGNRGKNSVVVDINSWVSRSEEWKIAIHPKDRALTCFETIQDAVQSGKHWEGRQRFARMGMGANHRENS